MAQVGDDSGLVDIAAAAALIGVSEQSINRLVGQVSLTATDGKLSRPEVIAFARQRRVSIDGMQEIADADEELGLHY